MVEQDTVDVVGGSGGRGYRGRERGGNMSRGARAESNSSAAGYNASFATLVDNAAVATTSTDAGSSGARLSFKHGKKLSRGVLRRGH